MELTSEEKQIIVNLLSQISIPVGQASIVLKIIDKLKFGINDKTTQKEVFDKEKPIV